MSSRHPHHPTPYAELHAHLGASVPPAKLWSIAHDQGIKLPTKNYWEFESMVVIEEPIGTFKDFREIDSRYYKLCELIQSSPLALTPIVDDIISGAYRSSNIVSHELRFNPAKRNRAGERDLDHIILAAINGMEKALLKYPQVKAGIILEMDRDFDQTLNHVILEKALKYRDRGIIGIDIAGPQNDAFDVRAYVDIFHEAQQHGLHTTLHTGEEGSLAEMKIVVNEIRPERIGHGVLAYQDKELMDQLVDTQTVLEVCPTSNLMVGVFKTIDEMRTAYQTLYRHGVTLTINTDWPEMHQNMLMDEFNFLKNHDIFTAEELEIIRNNAFKASFIAEKAV